MQSCAAQASHFVLNYEAQHSPEMFQCCTENSVNYSSQMASLTFIFIMLTLKTQCMILSFLGQAWTQMAVVGYNLKAYSLEFFFTSFN